MKTPTTNSILPLLEARSLTRSQLKAIFSKAGKRKVSVEKVGADYLGRSILNFNTKKVSVEMQAPHEKSPYSTRISLSTPGSPLRQKIAKSVRAVRKKPSDGYGLGLKSLKTPKGKQKAFYGHPAPFSSRKTIHATVFNPPKYID